MKLASFRDKEDSVRIIADTFNSNPSVNVVIGDKGDRKKKIRRLADYAFVKALNRNGAYISKNNMGTALFFRSNLKAFSFRELYYEIRFALTLAPSKIVQTLKREAYLKKNRFQGEHYYFWFLGVQKGGKMAGFELKDAVFKQAQEDQLPILLETSVYRNVVVYGRFGFNVYHIWTDRPNNIQVWFMKWEPDEVEKNLS